MKIGKQNLNNPQKPQLNIGADVDLLNLSNQNKELWRMLEQINIIMWESYMIKSRPFGRDEGGKIMEVLEQWAESY